MGILRRPSSSGQGPVDGHHRRPLSRPRWYLWEIHAQLRGLSIVFHHHRHRRRRRWLVTVNLDGPATHANFQRALPALRKAVVAHHLRRPYSVLLLPLRWIWHGGCHLTLLCFSFDRVRHRWRQWFYDPAEHGDPADPDAECNLGLWMEQTPLLPGNRRRRCQCVVIRTAGDGDGEHTLQQAFEPLRADQPTATTATTRTTRATSCVVAGGCCTAACLLFAVLVWRFAATTPETVTRLAAAAAAWGLRRRRWAGDGEHEHTDAVRRLYAWQTAVLRAVRRDDRPALWALFGVVTTDPRPCACGVFLQHPPAATNNQPQRTCSAPRAAGGWTLCDHHLRELCHIDPTHKKRRRLT